VRMQFNYISCRECGQSEPQEEGRWYRLVQLNKNCEMEKGIFVSHVLKFCFIVPIGPDQVLFPLPLLSSDWPHSLQPAYVIKPHPHPTHFSMNTDSSFLQP
jgi:hypothetical protein